MGVARQIVERPANRAGCCVVACGKGTQQFDIRGQVYRSNCPPKKKQVSPANIKVSASDWISSSVRPRPSSSCMSTTSNVPFCLSPKPQCLCFISAPTLDSSMMSTKSFLLWGFVPVTPWWLIRARCLRTTSLVNLKTPCSWMFLLVFPSSSVHICFCEIVSSVVHVVTQSYPCTMAKAFLNRCPCGVLQ